MFQIRLVGVMLMGLCLMVGCEGSDRVEVYPVRGLVTFEGKPLAGGGSIAFLPINDQKGKGAGATIDSDGRFVMSTYKDGDGSIAGQFRVLITQSVWDEPDNQGDTNPTPKGQNSKPVKRIQDDEMIPDIYAHVQNSPIIVEVGADTPREITIELTKSPNR
jgi:hypothetical protein